MNMNLSGYRWWMPSARDFFTNLAVRTAEGNNTVVLLNDLTDPAELGVQLAESIQHTGRMQPFTHDISDRPGTVPLVEMSRALRVRDDYSIERLVQTGEQPLVFIVYGLKPNTSNAQDWLLFARDWAARINSDLPGNILILMSPSSFQRLPQPCERFNYVRWDEHSSALEMSLCCRLHGQAQKVNASQQRWIEAMLSSLAPGDMKFAEHLWSVAGYANGVLDGTMRDYARQRGWQESDATRVISQFPQVIKKRGVEMSDWWGRGWLIHTAEYGFELHSALLALHPHGEETIIRRIWRAQASLVLPAIDRVRSRLIAKAMRYFPKNYDLSSKTELGELESFLRSENISRPGLYGLLSDTTFTRLLRNELAHYQPITFERYRELLDRDKEY